jgi:hypothetical protein
MTVLNITSKTDESGEVRLNLGVPNSHVTITVEIPDSPVRAKSKEEWETFVKRTAGCIKDPAFKRYPQGDFPVREPRQ